MKHYTLIKVLEKDHGGLTRAAFRRSTALRALGESVEVLSFNIIPDLRDVADYVRKNSELGDVPLRNLFHDLTYNDDAIRPMGAQRAKLSSDVAPLHPADHLTVDEQPFATATQAFRLRNYRDAKGVVTRVDFLNRHGKIFLIDERKANTGRPRRFTVVNQHTGEHAYQGGNYALQLAWIDSIVGNDEVALGIDGAELATVMKGYTKPNVIKNYFMHALHTEVGEHPTTGALRKDRVDALRSARTLDNIVCLTETQANDVRKRLIPACDVRVLPNIIATPAPAPSDRPRDPNLCVIVSRMDEGAKRLSLWLEAFSAARRENPKLHASVYGGPLDGWSWDTVQATRDRLNLSQAVTFHGHEHNAAKHFYRAGFTVLSSKHEGFGMTLPEAMSRGAIPVAFDINYGPSDIISNAVDGFLVPDGDTDALASAIVRASRIPTNDGMRDAAMRSARRYTPESIGKAYLDLVADTKTVSGERRKLSDARLQVDSISADADGQSISVRGTWSPGDFPRLTSVELVATDHHTVRSCVVPAASFDQDSTGLLARFDIRESLFDGLGRKDVTGWVRLRGQRGAQDFRPSWSAQWSAWPGLSPTNQFNLR